MEPATAMLISTAISTAAKAAGDKMSGNNATKASKRRAKEAKRETLSGLVHDAMQRSGELEAHRMSTRQKLGKRKAASSQETSDLVRGALSI